VSKQKEPQFFDTPWVEALTLFTGDIPSPGTLVKRGARYPRDNPVVQAYPKNFCSENLTADEKGRIYNERFYREPAAYEPTAFLPGPPKDGDMVVCTTTQVGYGHDAHGTMTPLLDNHQEGQRFRKNDPIVKSYPDHFRPLTPQEA
jgi:hypothetical protein